MSLKDLKINASAAANGKWIAPAGENADKTVPQFLLAHKGRANIAYQKALEKHTKPVRRLMQVGALPEKQAREIEIKVFAESVCLGWRHFQPEDDGNEIPYSVETCIEYMSNPEWSGLYSLLNQLADEAGNFNEVSREEDAKN